MTMSEYSNSIYADYGKIARGMRMYLKISQPAMYATIKLIQFMARGIKAKFFDKDITENFTKFLKETGGDYSIFRVPFKESDTREAAIDNIKNYLDKAGVKYCILESVNDEDKAVHVSIARKDEQKFSVMFTDYIKANLTSDKELNSNDLINLTNGKTTIVSVPDAALDVMKNALTETKVNFAELPDLIPDDGEKQLRVATADLNITKQCYESYKHSLIKNAAPDNVKESANVPDMKIYSEDDYLNTARRTPDEYMQSASDDIKAQIAEFEQLEATDAEKAMQQWDMEIQDSKSVNCQALRSNMAFSELLYHLKQFRCHLNKNCRIFISIFSSKLINCLFWTGTRILHNLPGISYSFRMSGLFMPLILCIYGISKLFVIVKIFNFIK